MWRWKKLAALALVAGCLWRGYAAIMGVHLEVLTAMASKLCAVAESGRDVSAEAMAEYVYPAKRAQEFLRQFADRSGRPSYQHFTMLLERYEALVRDADAGRAQGRDWKNDLPRLVAERDALQALAVTVRADLKSES